VTLDDLMARDDVKALMAKPLTPEMALLTEVVRAMAENEIVAWLTRGGCCTGCGSGDYCRATEFIADAIERGDHK
jgi:hypothetical protein